MLILVEVLFILRLRCKKKKLLEEEEKRARKAVYKITTPEKQTRLSYMKDL